MNPDEYSLGIAIGSLESVEPLEKVTWLKVQEATSNDSELILLMKSINVGHLPQEGDGLQGVLKYKRVFDDLSIVDSVIMYKDRIVMPSSLRPYLLQTLHAAHQGVSSMIARASTSIYWPGINEDVGRMRERCEDCNVRAPSQPSAPPTPLVHPRYPFQQICADYFHYEGNNYLAMVDRYSNWPSVFKSESGEGSRQFIKVLKSHCEIFGIPEELSSDGGPEFTSYETQKFFKNWGIRHRMSSVGFPHSNCRAELAVKTIKRMLMNNVSASGALDTDKFRRALLQYKNTPDKDTKLSPVQIVFGRPIRDFLPNHPKKYEPASVWSLTAEKREAALAKRHATERERLEEHTKKLPALKIGDSVYIQNQAGNFPLRWDKSGVIIEVRNFDQYRVEVD